MPQGVYILFGALYTVACVTALGKLLLRALGMRLSDCEEFLLGLVVGAPILSLVVFLTCVLGVARRGVFLWIGMAILALAWWRGVHRLTGVSLMPLPRLWKIILTAVFVVFGTLYLVNAMAPEWSPDGASYHLGLVARYLREHQFPRITTNMYANLSQGVEMLFLFAFSFGRHSSAALVHCAFLFALPLLMLAYARRFEIPSAGAFAAALVFTSPVVGIDGTSAYIDLAAAATVFAVFYLLRIWDADRSPRWLIPIGLVAGFAYSVKYTAALMVPYALGFIIWKSRPRGAALLRPFFIVSGCALLVMLPWILKNWLWLGNPFSPFANSLFPNPYITVGFEHDYIEAMRRYGLSSFREWPTAVTMHGELGGILGPVFLLAPLGLLAMGSSHGRLLLGAAAAAALPYLGNIGARFLIPALPFLSLALGLILCRWRFLPPAVALVHVTLSWPAIVALYVHPHNWQLSGFPWREALRVKSEDVYLESRKPDFVVTRALDRLTPRDAKVFTFRAIPEAYTSREVIAGFQSAPGAVMRAALVSAIDTDSQPAGRMRFDFPVRPLQRLRVSQVNTGLRSYWNVAEMRVFCDHAELQRSSGWRLRSWPNSWYVQLAFDNSPVTAWSTAEVAGRGMFLELDFGRPETIDAVLLEGPRRQEGIRLRLDAMDAEGKWVPLANLPVTSETQVEAGLRRMAVEALKANGIRYMIVFRDDWQAQDFMMNSHLWGMRQLAEINQARLYELP